MKIIVAQLGALMHYAVAVLQNRRPASLKRLLDRREDSPPPEKATAFIIKGLFYSLAISRINIFERLSRVNENYDERFLEAGQGVF